MAKADTESETTQSDDKDQPNKPSPVPQRKIPGNLPYIAASGTLKKAMDRLQDAARPDRYNADFLEGILKLTGGAARATIPLLKRMGFLSTDGAPTEVYAKFKTESGRGPAALAGLRNAFPEMFKRNEYAHALDDNKLRDVIVEITGLKANDPIVGAIRSTFNVVRAYIPSGFDATTQPEDSHQPENNTAPVGLFQKNEHNFGISYNINIVIPETSDIKVLNAIFRSVKENLLA